MSEQLSQDSATSSSDKQTVHVFGVAHHSKKNLQVIPEQSPSPLSAVYHEFAAPDEDGIWRWLVYALVTPPTVLRNVLQSTGDAVGRSMCEKAARTVANREELELQHLGRPRLTRAARIGYHALLWIPAALVLTMMPAGVIRQVGLFFTTVILFTVASCVTTWDEHRIRDRSLGRNIAQDLERREDRPAIVVVGADHIEGIVSHLDDAGHGTRVVRVVD